MGTSVRLALISALAVVAVPLSTSAASKFSWFDEAPARDALGFPRAPSLLKPDTRLTFGVDAYKSLAPGRLADDDVDSRPSDVLRIYGSVEPRLSSRAPLAGFNRAAGEESSLVDSANQRLSGFGVRWQHRVDAGSTLALSAGYNEFAWAANPTQSLDMFDTRAALSWTGTWSGDLRPGITSSIFVGDESTRDEAYQRLGRRYYGFSVGGQVTLFQDHTPYLSYRLRRNSYSGTDDPMYLLSPYEDHALVSAGWKWQARPNWSFQAEASYGLNGQGVDVYLPERSRFFFGTRFDFR